MADVVAVEGLAALQRDLRVMEKEVARELRKELKRAVDPVREAAQSKAGGIGHIGPRWSRMRSGVTLKGAYIAPATRRTSGSPRPNLGGLLLDQAMLPAVDEHSDAIASEVDSMLDRFGRDHGF